MTTTIRRISMAALIALSLTACGGGSDDTGDSADTANEQDADSSDGADSSDSATGDDSGSDVSGGAAEGDEPDEDTTIITTGDIAGVSAECEAIANFLGATGQLLGGQLDPAEGRAIIDEVLSAVDDSIRADAEVVADYTIAILEIIEQTGSFEAALSTPEGMEAMGGISTPEYGTATARLTEYLGECSLGG
jgi:hypothetical protein